MAAGAPVLAPRRPKVHRSSPDHKNAISVSLILSLPTLRLPHSGEATTSANKNHINA